jgi:nucleoside-diphosphate-sugar epimerase
MEWNDRQVVVTGASGFIGSHLTEALLHRGARVRALVHGDPLYHMGHLKGLHHERLEVLGGDLRDAHFVHDALADADTVFHLGALTSVAYSYTHPEEALAVNGMGSLNVFMAARKHGVRRVVHTSSAGVYGPTDRPITEDHTVSPRNPYTAAKLAADYMAEAFFHSYKLPVATLRLFNAYGPRMGRFLIIPTIIEQLLAGDEVRLGDVRPTRAFVYVDDIVQGFLRMAEVEGVEGQVVHLASGELVTIEELLGRIARLMGKTYRLITESSRLRPHTSDFSQYAPDLSKARILLGWEPQVDLDEGLRRTIAYFKGAFRE